MLFLETFQSSMRKKGHSVLSFTETGDEVVNE